MKTPEIHRAAVLRGRRGTIVLVGSALAMLVAGVLSGCGASTGSPTAGGSSSSATTSPSVTPSVTTSPAPSTTPATWRRLAEGPIGNDYEGVTSAWSGTEMLIVATVPAPAPQYCQEIDAAYDPAADTWRALPPVPSPQGCYEGGDRAVWTGKELLLWGVTNTAYNPATNRWRHLPGPPAGGGGPSVVVWTGKQMIGWGGGCCGETAADGAAYTPATDSWNLLPSGPLAGRYTMGAWTGTEMILAGGEGGEGDGGHIFADAAAYDPATKSWRSLPPMPVSRSWGEAVWDGAEVVIVGGETDTRPGTREMLARGVAYNPSTNRWRWLPAQEFAREGSVLVWDGHEVLMWGGDGPDGSVPPHGEAYDPVTDTWSALPRAPLRARVLAPAVWTGSELIIWGGRDARGEEGERFSDGAAFEPASG